MRAATDGRNTVDLVGDEKMVTEDWLTGAAEFRRLAEDSRGRQWFARDGRFHVRGEMLGAHDSLPPGNYRHLAWCEGRMEYVVDCRHCAAPEVDGG